MRDLVQIGLELAASAPGLLFVEQVVHIVSAAVLRSDQLTILSRLFVLVFYETRFASLIDKNKIEILGIILAFRRSRLISS